MQDRNKRGIEKSKSIEQLLQRLTPITDFNDELINTLLQKVNELYIKSPPEMDNTSYTAVLKKVIIKQPLYQLFLDTRGSYPEVCGYIDAKMPDIEDEITHLVEGQSKADGNGTKSGASEHEALAGGGAAPSEPKILQNVTLSGLALRLQRNPNTINSENWPILLNKIIELANSADESNLKALTGIFPISYNGETVLQYLLNHRAGEVHPDQQQALLLRCFNNEGLKHNIIAAGGKPYHDFAEFFPAIDTPEGVSHFEQITRWSDGEPLPENSLPAIFNRMTELLDAHNKEKAEGIDGSIIAQRVLIRLEAISQIFQFHYREPNSTILQAIINHSITNVSFSQQNALLLACANFGNLKTLIESTEGWKQYLNFAELISFDEYAQKDHKTPLIRKEHYDFAIVEDEAQFDTYFQQLTDKDGTNLDRFHATRPAQEYKESIYSYDIFDHILGSKLPEGIKTKRINQIIERFPNLQHRLYMLTSIEDPEAHSFFVTGYASPDVGLNYIENLTGVYAKPLPYSLRRKRLQYYKGLADKKATDLPFDGASNDDAVARIYTGNVSMPIEVKKFLLLEDQHFDLGFISELRNQRPTIAATLTTLSNDIVESAYFWNQELHDQDTLERSTQYRVEVQGNEAETPANEGTNTTQQEAATIIQAAFRGHLARAQQEQQHDKDITQQYTNETSPPTGETINNKKTGNDPEPKQQLSWFVRIWRAILSFFNRLFKPKATHTDKYIGSGNLNTNKGIGESEFRPDKTTREGPPPSPRK